MLKHLQSSEDWNEKSLGAKGFTLIELLVVIVILGILAAVVVFAVSGIKDKGQDSACTTQASTVRTAQEAKFAQDGTYQTGDLSALVPGYLSKNPDTKLVNDNGTSTNTLNLTWGTGCTNTSKIGTAP